MVQLENNLVSAAAVEREGQSAFSVVLREWSEHRVAEGHGCTAKLRMVKLQVPPSSGGPELWVQVVTQS